MLGRLKNLKKITLPRECWNQLVSCGLDMATPQQTLEGLVMTDVSDGSTVAWVEKRPGCKHVLVQS